MNLLLANFQEVYGDLFKTPKRDAAAYSLFWFCFSSSSSFLLLLFPLPLPPRPPSSSVGNLCLLGNFSTT